VCKKLILNNIIFFIKLMTEIIDNSISNIDNLNDDTEISLASTNENKSRDNSVSPDSPYNSPQICEEIVESFSKVNQRLKGDEIIIPSMKGLNLDSKEKEKFKKEQSRLINLKKYRENEDYREKIKKKNLEYARDKYNTDEYRTYMNNYMKNKVNKTDERKTYMRDYMKKYMKEYREKKKNSN
jgi:hypothetical protein